MTEQEKKDYRDRRNKGLRGQTGFANIHMVVKDEKDKEQRIPIGFHAGKFGRGQKTAKVKGIDRRFTKKGFTGHKIGNHYVPPTFELSLTNHQRHLMRKNRRAVVAQEKREAEQKAN